MTKEAATSASGLGPSLLRRSAMREMAGTTDAAARLAARINESCALVSGGSVSFTTVG